MVISQPPPQNSQEAAVKGYRRISNNFKRFCVMKHSSFKCMLLIFSVQVSLYLFQRNFLPVLPWTPTNCDGYFHIRNNASKHDVKLAMTIEPRGRLGNLMGQYASLLALSRINGYKAVLIPNMESLQAYFSLSLPTLNKEVASRIPWKKTRIWSPMKTSYKQFDGSFIKLIGFPHSWTFYHHIRDEILQEFTFHPPIVKDVQAFLHKSKSNKRSTTFIGVHVRRGDYVYLMLNKFGGVLADSKYLSEAMDEYRNHYSDLPWCEKHIDMTRGDVVLCWNGSTSSPGRDMALLSQCNHSITTIGTFGYWASYLAGGDVIYLSNFTHPNSKYIKHVRPHPLKLPHWKGIAANLNSIDWLDNTTGRTT